MVSRPPLPPPGCSNPNVHHAGPIIRVSPFELHIDDPDYYDVLYGQDRVRNKYEWTDGRLGNPLSFFGTSNHTLHRMRRAPFNSMFSKQQITKFEPIIHERLDALFRHLCQYADTDKVIPLNLAYTAFSQDVICQFGFARHFHCIESPGFEDTLLEGYQAAVQSSHLALQFPWLLPVMNSLPNWLVVGLQPKLRRLISLQQVGIMLVIGTCRGMGFADMLCDPQFLSQKVEDIRNDENEDYKKVNHPTLFRELLQSNLPPQEKSIIRLMQEAQSVIGAGLTTTSWALAVASFYIINEPDISHKLREELVRAMPDPSKPLAWAQLEKLPYLSGCVHEGLRLSYGVTSRLARVDPDEVLNYKDWKIPPGTPVSQTIVDVNHNETIFPDSHCFVPERWYPTNPQRVKDRHFVVFSKGTRMCIGLK